MRDRVNATFFLGDDGKVHVDLGRLLRVLHFDHTTAFAWANALQQLGAQAQRTVEGKLAMSKKEVDQIEEAICGRPTLRGS